MFDRKSLIKINYPAADRVFALDLESLAPQDVSALTQEQQVMTALRVILEKPEKAGIFSENVLPFTAALKYLTKKPQRKYLLALRDTPYAPVATDGNELGLDSQIPQVPELQKSSPSIDVNESDAALTRARRSDMPISEPKFLSLGILLDHFSRLCFRVTTRYTVTGNIKLACSTLFHALERTKSNPEGSDKHEIEIKGFMAQAKACIEAYTQTRQTLKIGRDDIPADFIRTSLEREGNPTRPSRAR